MNKLIVRIATERRDTDGVRIDRMLTEIGANVERELPRVTGRYVDLLVEHTSAPEEVRGQVVVPVFDEVPDPAGGADPVLSFDRWQVWTPETAEA
jgi:hypothetical protein